MVGEVDDFINSVNENVLYINKDMFVLSMIGLCEYSKYEQLIGNNSKIKSNLFVDCHTIYCR